MSDTIIKIENVSKKFSRNLKHVMRYGLEDIGRNLFGIRSRSDYLRNGEFWALNDVSFEIKQGETLGIIGPNGSGKSTLLKLINGIFMPDRGEIEITGKIGGLIEVGAGFHPMLTGRENIYINGAILGLSRNEIDERFEDIIAFAGIGDFIDAPVKHYSSGMYVRLGFSVMVYAQPDILLIDEVLAVGDLSFQRKCMDRMLQMIHDGKTTLIFVSHAIRQVVRVCERVVYLKDGKLIEQGKAESVAVRYMMAADLSYERERVKDKQYNQKNGSNVNISNVEIRNSSGEYAQSILMNEGFDIIVSFSKHNMVNTNVSIAIQIRTVDDFEVAGVTLGRTNEEAIDLSNVKQVTCKILSQNMNPGKYYLTVKVSANMVVEDVVHRAVSFQVTSERYNDVVARGVVTLPHEWSLNG